MTVQSVTPNKTKKSKIDQAKGSAGPSQKGGNGPHTFKSLQKTDAVTDQNKTLDKIEKTQFREDGDWVEMEIHDGGAAAKEFASDEDNSDSADSDLDSSEGDDDNDKSEGEVTDNEPSQESQIDELNQSNSDMEIEGVLWDEDSEAELEKYRKECKK